MIPLQDVWDRLTTEGDADARYVRLRVPEITAAKVYLARGLASEREALLLEVNTSSLSGDGIYPDAKGFSVHAMQLTSGRKGTTILALDLSDERYRDVYFTLVDDVVVRVRSATDEKDAVRLFLSRLERWQVFLRRHGHNGLSREERRGLYGELVLLRDHLLDRTTPICAVNGWTGCRGTHHDYQFDTGSIEVKTSAATSAHGFHVSSIRQLEAPSQGELFLFFTMIDESEAGSESLTAVVADLRTRLEGESLYAFDERLEDSGYLDKQSALYDKPKYTVRSSRFFRVDAGFPRLRESDLPSGVEDVSYVVALAACVPFEVDAEESLMGIFPTEGAVDERD